jgi:hypothetical protein
MHELSVYMFSFCINLMLNLMYVIRYRLYFVLETVCRLCFLSRSEGRDDVNKSVVTRSHSSDGQNTPVATELPL